MRSETGNHKLESFEIGPMDVKVFDNVQGLSRSRSGGVALCYADQVNAPRQQLLGKLRLRCLLTQIRFPSMRFFPRVFRLFARI